MFPNYTLEIDNLGITDKKARTGILIHNDIQYRRRNDLETQGTSTVWIQLNQAGRKSLLIQGIYRQFQRLGKPNSDTPKAQTLRWDKIIQKWELAMQENKEILVLGDLNPKFPQMGGPSAGKKFLWKTTSTTGWHPQWENTPKGIQNFKQHTH